MNAVARLCLLGTPLVILLACSGTATPAANASAAGTAAAGGNTGEVAAEGFAFKPGALEVTVGTKVTWTNKDAAQHTVTAGKPDAKETTFVSVIDPGKTFTFSFDKPGAFAYFCERHVSMVGTVAVK